MSSSERYPSQASTTFESPTTTAASGDKLAPGRSIDDPWLVSFSPDDPENPMVRCACWAIFIAFMMFNISLPFAELASVETLVHHVPWRHPSFEFVRASHCWNLPSLI